ncbi:hypothetical protein [Granulicella aggregans]|uniref:hypothetical protein n=1 Tax=Granulicella aggregans TaxID=474949 RepID=UPI0021E08D18|nr:hypothetical protein [Granulicella aggregans]
MTSRFPFKGAVDDLAYSGPASRSTLQNMDIVAKQLEDEGFKPIFNRVRAACCGFECRSLACPGRSKHLCCERYGEAAHPFEAGLASETCLAPDTSTHYILLHSVPMDVSRWLRRLTGMQF